MDILEHGGYQIDLSIIEDDAGAISTGHLPIPDAVRAAVHDAYEQFRSVTDGANASYYPALAQVDPDYFGIAIAGSSGELFTVGDVDIPFTIMSIAKPFVLALVLESLGAERVRELVGVNATGYAFNSVIPVERSGGRLSNPMVNAGALATTSLMPGANSHEKWHAIVDGLSRFAGRKLELHDEVFASASQTNVRNRALVNLLSSYERIYDDPIETLDLYTRQSSLAVTARDLGLMGATLANGGVHPHTRDRVVSAPVCRRVLAVMATAGLYETSGEWLYDVGLPGKSGVGGGIVTVSPGKGSLATFAPPLDSAGNSVRGQLVARYLAQRLGLDLFSSTPDAPQNISSTSGNHREKE